MFLGLLGVTSTKFETSALAACPSKSLLNPSRSVTRREASGPFSSKYLFQEKCMDKRALYPLPLELLYSFQVLDTPPTQGSSWTVYNSETTILGCVSVQLLSSFHYFFGHFNSDRLRPPPQRPVPVGTTTENNWETGQR